MNKQLIDQLNPQEIWQHFSMFCLIPRPSKHEQAIVAYIRQQGEMFNALVEQDDTGNILLRIPASSGFESAPIVALQSHVDMVAQANSDSQHDFMKDPLKLQVYDGWLSATGTTLGADNGIGCAAMLALMTDGSITHGPLELLFTVDEEAGMGGAFGLQSGWLKAKQLLNLDTEEEGEIYIGCAGGVDINSTMPLEWQAPKPDTQTVEISLTGLLGGHSGVDIHLNRANANILMAQELLLVCQKFEIQIQQLTGGTLRNAIPREAFISVYTNKADKLIQWISERNTLLCQLYKASEQHLCFSAKKTNSNAQPVLSLQQSMDLLNLFASHPNGVIKNSDAISGVVESSNNLGVIELKPDEALTILNLCRSASDEERDAHAQRIAFYQQRFGLSVDISGAYPGWQPNNESPLLKQSLNLYQQLYKEEASIQVIHAGLECGLLSGKYPDCDMISFGPTITGAHSPREQVNIKSVEKFWHFLVQLITQIGKN
ncbi:MAG: aminoacyl-histidine dipeptidase [Gammaproteobacteria bacterium]|nr:aminoacyl-histidine dipeptidase [Gammaproteobacteria bacterium]